MREREKIDRLISLGKIPTLYCGMDGVAVDFMHGANSLSLTPDKYKLERGAYYNLKPIPHAFEILNAIEEQIGLNIHLLTKIPDENPYAATEKLLFLRQYAPNRAVNVTITPDKGSVGNDIDYLVDDRLHKANVKAFKGRIIHFVDYLESWKEIVRLFEINYKF